MSVRNLITVRVIGILCWFNDSPWYETSIKELTKLLTSIDDSAVRGMHIGNCSYCRSIHSKITGED